MQDDDFLLVSPYKEDRGEKIGRDPRSLDPKTRRSGIEKFGWLPSLPRAIRAKCLDCCGGSSGEIRKCVAISCPLWPHRMGTNTLHANSMKETKNAE